MCLVSLLEPYNLHPNHLESAFEIWKHSHEHSLICLLLQVLEPSLHLKTPFVVPWPNENSQTCIKNASQKRVVSSPFSISKLSQFQSVLKAADMWLKAGL